MSIQSKLIEKLPEKKEIEYLDDNGTYNQLVLHSQGFNDCLSQVKEIINTELPKIVEEMEQDIKTVKNQLAGIEDEKARRIENYIDEYLLNLLK